MLEKIKIKNLANHKETIFDLTSINYILGPPGSGKSTIKWAVRLALSSDAKSFYKKNYYKFIRNDKNKGSVSLIFDNGDMIKRTIYSSGKHDLLVLIDGESQENPQEYVNNKFPESISLLWDSYKFLDFTPNEIARKFEGYAGIDYNAIVNDYPELEGIKDSDKFMRNMKDKRLKLTRRIRKQKGIAKQRDDLPNKDFIAKLDEKIDKAKKLNESLSNGVVWDESYNDIDEVYGHLKQSRKSKKKNEKKKAELDEQISKIDEELKEIRKKCSELDAECDVFNDAMKFFTDFDGKCYFGNLECRFDNKRAQEIAQNMENKIADNDELRMELEDKRGELEARKSDLIAEKKELNVDFNIESLKQIINFYKDRDIILEEEQRKIKKKLKKVKKEISDLKSLKRKLGDIQNAELLIPKLKQERDNLNQKIKILEDIDLYNYMDMNDDEFEDLLLNGQVLFPDKELIYDDERLYLDGLSYDQLSKSEKYRIGIIWQVAMASKLDYNVLILDGLVDLLTRKHKNNLHKFLRKSDIGRIIVMFSMNKADIKDKKSENIKVFILEDGEIKNGV